MDITTGAISCLLPKLDALCAEAHRVKGARQDIEYVSKEMVSFQAALHKLAEVPLDQLDPEARIWAVEAKELSYNIDDVVNKLLMALEGSEPANLDDLQGHKMFSNLFKKKGRQQIVLAAAIKEIKAVVMQTAKRPDRYSVGDAVPFPASRTMDSPLIIPWDQDPKYIIGVEESSEDLMKKIICRDDYSSKRQLKILSIFGCMGLGKTTLAKAVYEKLQGDNFDCCAFVSVGRHPDLKKTLKDLLFEVGAERFQDVLTLDETQLINELRMLLKEKRYLIIVDDIWDIQAWETIQHTFLDHDFGSSVIITTRNFEVAQKAGEVYKMKPLCDEKSEELFCERLFGGKDKIPDQLLEVTKSIVKKCDCIPLAIVAMASSLVGIRWEDWSLVYNSTGLVNINDRVAKEIRNISLISYYDIPSHLRSCLVHLSIFPEGYMIRKDTLIWKWIALGFVREEPGVGLFEVGERYFNELINKSLVQPVEIPHSGIIIGCRVNFMVLDMICFLSREENFVTVLDSHKQDTSDPHQARLLAIQNCVVDEGFVQENEMLANQPVRSFSATKCEFQMMPSLASFQCLRVLALEDCASVGGIYHLEHIRELVQLRYLGLLNTPICELPGGIGNLKFVQTLDLRQTEIEALPRGILLLTQLKCLRAGSRSITVPDGMGNLASLEELQLSDVSGSPNIVKELGKLTELRNLKLRITLSDERSKRDLVDSLGYLQKIEILHLDGGLWIEDSCWDGYIPSRYLRRVLVGMKFIRLPAWINPMLLPKLSHLSVDVSVLEEEDLLILGSFPELIYLSLAGEYVCLPDILGSGAFPSLKYCYTSGMVRFLNGAAPGLEYVSFNVRLWGPKDGSFDLDFRCLLDHPLLQEIRVEIFYTEAHFTEVDKVEAALSDIVAIHPNRLILDIGKWKSSASEQFGSHDDVDGNEYYDDNEEDTDHKYYNDDDDRRQGNKLLHPSDDIYDNEYYDDNEEDTDHKYYNDEDIPQGNNLLPPSDDVDGNEYYDDNEEDTDHKYYNDDDRPQGNKLLPPF